MMSAETAEKFELLVKQLIGSTRAQTVKWRSGFTNDSFVAALKKGSVRIARFEDHWRDDDGAPYLNEWYELEILDQHGVCGERLSSSPSQTGDDSLKFPQQPLAELFRIARANAVDVDAVVDAILGELG